MPVDDGTGLTLAVSVVVPVHPLKVAATVYMLAPVTVGVIVGDAQVVHDKPAAPVHV